MSRKNGEGFAVNATISCIKKMISVTGKKIRVKDNWGEGHYMASRGRRKHKGTDYICNPGQEIISPIKGIVIREAKPYAKSDYSGLLIKGKQIEIKMFYFKPRDGLKGMEIQKGEIIGIAQNIAEKYPGMIPHIHVEVVSIDPEIVTDYL
jgi:hypothetical protein